MNLLKKKFAVFSCLVGLATYTLTPNTLGEVRIEGEVLRAYPDYFLLTNEEGLTLVEMDDVDSYSESINLIPGDNVVVKGEPDLNASKEASVEARSVLVKNLNTLYLLDATDDEGIAEFYPDFDRKTPLQKAAYITEARGFVESVKGSVAVLKTQSGDRLRVNLASLNCCEPNSEEMVKVKLGDEIAISGRLKDNLFGPDTIEARNLLIYKY